MAQFNDPTFGNPAPPPRSSSMKWVIIVLVVLTLLGTVCCGGCVAIIYFGTQQLALQIASDIQDNPAVQEHLGDDVQLTMNLEASSTEQQQRGRQVWVFDAEGSKGSGTVIVLPSRGGAKPYESAILRLPDGQELPLE